MQTIYKSQAQIFDNMKYVLKARSTDKIKPIFTMVYINKVDGVIVCSDSRQLHLWNIKDESFFDGYEDGLYNVIKSDAREIVLNLNTEYVLSNFPDYKRIIPKKEVLIEVVKIQLNTFSNASIGKFYHAYYKKFNDENSGILFNSELFNNSFNKFSEFSIQVIEENAKSGGYMSPILFSADDILISLIMPIQRKE